MIQLRAQVTHARAHVQARVGTRFSASLPLSTFSVPSVLKDTFHPTSTSPLTASLSITGDGSRATDHATQKGRT
jgi:hypothetical protein